MKNTNDDILINAYFILSVLSILVLFIVTILLFILLKDLVTITYIASLQFTLLALIGISYILYKIILNNLLKELKISAYYIKTIEALHNNVRCFKHDFNNIVQSIGGYLELDDLNGLKAFYSSLRNDCLETNTLDLLSSKFGNNPSIYGILSDKFLIASKLNVKMECSIHADISNLTNNIYEISRILGILLDNAVESASETDLKLVNVIIKYNRSKYIFEIRNTFINKDIPIDKLFEKGFSTKNHNSGIGLWEVHKILSKNTNLDLYTKIDQNMFVQQFEIFNVAE